MELLETLLRRVWDEYGMRGDLSVDLLEKIEAALKVERYTCGCPVLHDAHSFCAYCPTHDKPIAAPKGY